MPLDRGKPGEPGVQQLVLALRSTVSSTLRLGIGESISVASGKSQLQQLAKPDEPSRGDRRRSGCGRSCCPRCRSRGNESPLIPEAGEEPVASLEAPLPTHRCVPGNTLGWTSYSFGRNSWNGTSSGSRRRSGRLPLEKRESLRGASHARGLCSSSRRVRRKSDADRARGTQAADRSDHRRDRVDLRTLDLFDIHLDITERWSGINGSS